MTEQSTNTRTFTFSSNRAKGVTTTIEYRLGKNNEWIPVKKVVVEHEYEKAPVQQPAPVPVPMPHYAPPTPPVPSYPLYTTWRGPQA